LRWNPRVAEVTNVIRLTVAAFQALALWNKATGPCFFTGTQPFFRLHQPNRRGVFLFAALVPN